MHLQLFYILMSLGGLKIEIYTGVGIVGSELERFVHFGRPFHFDIAPDRVVIVCTTFLGNSVFENLGSQQHGIHQYVEIFRFYVYSY